MTKKVTYKYDRGDRADYIPPSYTVYIDGEYEGYTQLLDLDLRAKDGTWEWISWNGKTELRECGLAEMKKQIEAHYTQD